VPRNISTNLNPTATAKTQEPTHKENSFLTTYHHDQPFETPIEKGLQLLPTSPTSSPDPFEQISQPTTKNIIEQPRRQIDQCITLLAHEQLNIR